MLEALWERLAGWARRGAAAALAGGSGGGAQRPIPAHVAFIMDGNRRYAEALGLARVAGHAHGYQRLLAALEWCLELGVRCVSVYAFSIDNYRRSGEEVSTLMALAQDRLGSLLQECEALARHGVQVRVIGDLSLAPPAVQAAARRVMAATAHHDRAVLNLCFSYTASEELLQAVDKLAAGGGAPSSSSSGSGGGGGGASSAALEGCLYTAGCPPVDLVVRTSGETRLSDFLLWQSRHALLVFTPVLWPDFGFLDLVAAVLEYQRHAERLGRLRAAAAAQAAAHCRPQQPRQQLEQLVLPPVKVSAAARQQRGSPCSIASPASPSSPSSRSEASAEDGAAAAAAAAAELAPALRQRHAAAAAAAALPSL